jgi:DNA polymerase-3 subunit gamma/tau
MLSTAAFNALLKTLEEPPSHAKFILATTEVHKIPATILSRCQRYDFRRIPVEEIRKHLKQKAAEEGLQVDDEALTLIARQATGAMRDAISLLDQLSSTGEKVTLAEAQMVLGTATSSVVVDMVDCVVSRDPARGFHCIQTALDAGTDARQLARQVVDYLRGLLLVRMGNADQVDVTREMRESMARHAAGFDPLRLLEAIRLFNAAAADSRSSWHPGLALELALAEMVEEKPAPTVSQPAVGGQPAVGSQLGGQPAVRQEPARTPPAAPSERANTARQIPPPGSQAAAGSHPEEKPRQSAAQRPAPEKSARQIADPTAPAAENHPPSGAGSINQHELQQQWGAIKRAVKKKNPMTEALLNSLRSMVVKGDVLVLGFQSEMVKSKMESTENMEILRQALQSALGAAPIIRCAIAGARSSSPSDLDIDGDGMVGTALDLGGKIVFEE